jgi:hypothetical protein
LWDFDSAIPRFESWRPSHSLRRVITDPKYGVKSGDYQLGLAGLAVTRMQQGGIARCGYEVQPVLPGYVKPYVKHNKHDAANAEAVCEAVPPLSMRCAPEPAPAQAGVGAKKRPSDRTKKLEIKKLTLTVRGRTRETNVCEGKTS